MANERVYYDENKVKARKLKLEKIQRPVSFVENFFFFFARNIINLFKLAIIFN